MRIDRFLRFGVRHVLGYESRAVGINLTRRCNLSCDYCRIYDNSREKFKRELTVEQWQAIIERFVGFGRQHFVFTGGEPFVYRGLPELIEWTSKRAMTSLITNTTYLNEERFASIAALDFITFSLDTLRNDDVHQKDSLSQLALIAEQCERYGITPSAIVTVTSQNVDDIEAMVRVLDDHGITAMLSLIHSSDDPHFDFRAYTPHLEFRTEDDLARLDALAVRLKELKREGIGLSENDHYIDHMSAYAKGEFQVDCPAADPFFTIDFDGRIKACHDTPASDVHALEFQDWDAMKREVRTTIKPDCNCYYNCYVYGKSTLTEDLTRVLAR